MMECHAVGVDAAPVRRDERLGEQPRIPLRHAQRSKTRDEVPKIVFRDAAAG